MVDLGGQRLRLLGKGLQIGRHLQGKSRSGQACATDLRQQDVEIDASLFELLATLGLGQLIPGRPGRRRWVVAEGTQLRWGVLLHHCERRIGPALQRLHQRFHLHGRGNLAARAPKLLLFVELGRADPKLRVELGVQDRIGHAQRNPTLLTQGRVAPLRLG